MTWLPVSVTAEPATEPVTTAEAKSQARVDSSAEDTLIADYNTAARQLVEQYTGTRLVSQTVDFRGSAFADLAALPVAPIISVTSVKYLDSAGAEQTLSTNVYEAVTTGLVPSIRLKVGQSWPSPRDAVDAVRVVAVAGYATVPEPIRHAIMLTVAKWVDDRTMGELPSGAFALLENYRR